MSHFQPPISANDSIASAALKGALRALDLNSGDEIITSCFTYVATAEGIIEAGGSPVFTDIDNTYNMDPKDLESKITDNTRKGQEHIRTDTEINDKNRNDGTRTKRQEQTRTDKKRKRNDKKRHEPTIIKNTFRKEKKTQDKKR